MTPNGSTPLLNIAHVPKEMEGRAYCGVYVRRGPQVCLVRAITASNGGRCECGETLDQATMGRFVPRLSGVLAQS